MEFLNNFSKTSSKEHPCTLSSTFWHVFQEMLFKAIVDDGRQIVGDHNSSLHELGEGKVKKI